jgi:DNA-binding LytR/AlgR family response regulator/dihydrofolate reductase
MIRTVLVDDEALALARLRRLLESEPDITVVAECDSGQKAIEAIAAFRPELLFLDVQMPEIDGFDVLRAISPDNAPCVVFVTAYDAHAVRAFEVRAVDYLLKPIDGERVQQACARVRAVREQATAAQRYALLREILDDVGTRRGTQRLLVRDNGTVKPVRVDDIDWIDAVGNYARLHVSGTDPCAADHVASARDQARCDAILPRASVGAHQPRPGHRGPAMGLGRQRRHLERRRAAAGEPSVPRGARAPPGSERLSEDLAMRIVTYGAACSLDGFIAGPDGGVEWLHMSRDVHAIMAEYWATIDTLVWGRKTWDLAASQGGMGESTPMHNYVFSRTLESVSGAELVASDPGAFVNDLRRKPGKGICVMSGGHLAQALFAADAIDEVGLNIHPVLLGAGVPLFRDPGKRVVLEIKGARTIDGGCLYATYRVKTSHSGTSSRATSGRGKSHAPRRGE